MNLAFCLLVGPFRLSIRNKPDGWHKNGYHKSEIESSLLPETTTIREIGLGWFSFAVITDRLNPNYKDEDNEQMY